MRKVVDVQVLALGDVDIDTATAEGEGFAEWRMAHEAFWNGDQSPSLCTPASSKPR
jgi:uncharacterized protein YhfF